MASIGKYVSSNQVETTRTWQGIPIIVLTNVETGQAEAFINEGIFGNTKIAEVGANNQWSLSNPDDLAKRLTNKTGTTYTSSTATREFFLTGAPRFNEDRGTVINQNSPYNTRTYLATKPNPVPNVIDPRTGIQSTQTQQTQQQTQQQSQTAASTAGGSVPIDPEYLDINPIQGSAEVKKYGTLYYPLNRRNPNNYDYLKVTAIQLTQTGLRTTAESFNVVSVQERSREILGQIFLPMQPGISDTNGVSWNEDSLNPFQAALGGVAAEAIMTAGSGDVVNAAKGLVQGLINTATGIANEKGMQKYISAYFAGQAVGTNLVARTTGAVLNNNLELLFNGPKLRSFRYSFRFTPREEDESIMIKKIIRLFKREMAASKSDTGLFLTTPSVFELEYKTFNDEPHPFLNKIKRCALTDMSVNYTPDGSYMTYQDRSMTSYDLQLQFSELEPIYKEDYDNGPGKDGMGY